MVFNSFAFLLFQFYSHITYAYAYIFYFYKKVKYFFSINSGKLLARSQFSLCILRLFDFHEFDREVKSSSTWDDPLDARIAVAQLWGHCQGSNLTKTHSWNSLLVALNHLRKDIFQILPIHDFHLEYTSSSFSNVIMHHKTCANFVSQLNLVSQFCPLAGLARR